jgi:hypothetical protein
VEKLTRILAIADRTEDVPQVLEKSVSLARRFGARVEIVVTNAEQTRAVMNLCCAGIWDEVLVTCVDRGVGPLAELIRDRAQAGAPDLIVKSTADRLTVAGVHEGDIALAAEIPIPVLIVRSLAWADPPSLVVPVDVTDSDLGDSSRRMLEAAAFLTNGCRGNLDILYSERELDDEVVRMERAVEVAQLVRELNPGRGRLQMFSGAPQERLPPLIAARQYDVLVLGVGTDDDTADGTRSLARSFAAATRGDLVLVRAAPQTDTRLAARRLVSGREQRAHQP